MNKIYNDAKDVFVSAVLVYAGADGKANIDNGEESAQFEAADLMDAFNKGCIIVASGKFYKPVCAEVDASTGAVTLTYNTVVESSGTTTVEAETVVSKVNPA